jgi:hypothetical protein
MSQYSSSYGARPKGFFASLGLAFRIAVGSLRLLKMYPVLVLPLLPVFFMVMLALFGLMFISNTILALSVVFVVAYALMFSFAITSHMLKQIHDGGKPSILAAISASSTLRMIPRVLLLSAIWYVLVSLLVAIETAVRTLLDRISDKLADALIEAVLGTLADALRMAGFMMVAIMTFEDTGVSPALGRMRSIVKDNPIVAVGGLTLTKMSALVIFAVVFFLSEIIGDAGSGFIPFAVVSIALASGWMLAMFLEQIFVTGLYLYTTAPSSSLVGIILQDQIGRELPELPPPDWSEQPAL